MGLAAGSQLVVVAPGSRRMDERAKGALIAGVAEAPVPGKAGRDHPAARGFGHRCRAGVVLARPGSGETGPVITQLAQHPGTKDRPRSWQGSDDLGVRVLLEMLRERRLEFGWSRRDIPPAACLLTDPKGHALAVGLMAEEPPVLPPGGSETSSPLASQQEPRGQPAVTAFDVDDLSGTMASFSDLAEAALARRRRHRQTRPRASGLAATTCGCQPESGGCSSPSVPRTSDRCRPSGHAAGARPPRRRRGPRPASSSPGSPDCPPDDRRRPVPPLTSRAA